MERIGILGGTFDPIHEGHMLIARSMIKRLGLDSVMLLPSGNPPHKTTSAASGDRLAMVRLAAQGSGHIAVSTLEMEREGNTYTVETMRAMRRIHPDAQFTYVIGSDTLLEIKTWYEVESLFRLCDIAVVVREGVEPDAHADAIMRWIKGCGGRIGYLEMEIPGISSTQVRETAAAGRSLRGLVPRAVEDYITQRGLYRQWTREQMLAWMKERMNAKRLKHVLGVEETARKLAQKYKCDPARAALAGLLHDCAKPFKAGEMFQLAREYNVPVDDMMRENPGLLHPLVGERIARHIFGVSDAQVLSAIRYHQLGAPDMTELDIVVNLADKIEPGRDYNGVDKLRAAAAKDLYGGFTTCMAWVLGYTLQKRSQIHPDSILTWNAICANKSNKRTED